MTAELVTGPATEPVTATEAKKHLELGSGSTHDDQVNLLIEAARNQWEHDTDSGVISQTWKVEFETFDGWWVQLPKAPLASITSVKYYDLNNTQQTLSSSTYSVDTANRRIHLAYGQNWPTTLDRWDSVEITYVIGYANAAAVPAIVRQAILLLVGHYFENRDMLVNDVLFRTAAYENLVRRYMRSSYP